MCLISLENEKQFKSGTETMATVTVVLYHLKIQTQGNFLLRTINDKLSQSWPSEQLRQIIRGML